MRLPIPIYEVHSKKTQPQRTKVIRQFTPARSGVMLSTDVIARGTEIPGITKVIQVGLPKNPEQCKISRGVLFDVVDLEAIFRYQPTGTCRWMWISTLHPCSLGTEIPCA